MEIYLMVEYNPLSKVRYQESGIRRREGRMIHPLAPTDRCTVTTISVGEMLISDNRTLMDYQ